jgi:hypothetical protein
MGALIDHVSFVPCVSWCYRVNAAETHETVRWESGMRYHHNMLWWARFGTHMWWLSAISRTAIGTPCLAIDGHVRYQSAS